MVAINVNGPPTPIAGLPDAAVPLTDGSFIALDETQSGPTVRTTLLQLAQYVGASAAGGSITLTYHVASAGGAIQLPSSGGTVFVTNTVATLECAPAAVMTEGAITIVKDAGGTAGTYPITLLGTMDGEVNPTLIDVAFAWATLQYSNGLVYRVG